MQITITPTKAKMWISSNESCPDEWAFCLKGKYGKITESIAKGFMPEGEEGDIIGDHRSCDITPKQFRKWVKKSGEVRVWMKNPDKQKMIEAINVAERKVKILGANYNEEMFLKYAYIILDDISEHTCKWLKVNEYDFFYKKGIRHHVDMCYDEFFGEYPDAIKDRGKL